MHDLRESGNTPAIPGGWTFGDNPDLRTSSERIADLTAQVDELNRARAQMAAQLRELSEQLQAVRR